MGRERSHGTLRVKLRGAHGPVLFLQLSPTLPFFPLDPLALLRREHLLVLNPKFPALKFKVVEHLDHRGGLFGGGEVCKRQAPKDAIVEMVVERVGKREAQFGHQLHQLFLLDGKRDVLDDDGGQDQVIVRVLSRRFRPDRIPLKGSRAEI